MPVTKTLGVLKINHVNRQAVASDGNTDKRKTSRQSKRVVQKEGKEPKSCKNKMQDADMQKQCNVNNTAEPGVDTNPTVIVNNSYKGFLSDQIREDDIKKNIKQANQRNNNNHKKAPFQRKLEKITQQQM